MKHTPPPWRVRRLSNGTLLINTENGDIAEVFNEYDIFLITAAPELLDICKHIFESVWNADAVLEDNEQLLDLKQAIAKAEKGE